MEGFLKNAGKQHGKSPGDAPSTAESPGGPLGDSSEETSPSSAFPSQQPGFPLPQDENLRGASGNARYGELLGLGRFESLPPFEMIEEL